MADGIKNLLLSSIDLYLKAGQAVNCYIDYFVSIA